MEKTVDLTVLGMVDKVRVLLLWFLNDEAW